MHKKILTVAVLLMIVVLVATPVFADIPVTFPSGGTAINTVATSAKNVWATVVVVVQILAFAAIVFAGLRYMFASADQRADIKKGLGMLVIGSILVFAASTVVGFVVNAVNDVLP